MPLISTSLALLPVDVLRVGRKLPSAPEVFSQLGSLLESPDSDLVQVAELVKVDAALAFRVLQISNGALFGFSRPCASIDEAVQRVGFREVHRLVGLIAAQQLFNQGLTLYGIENGPLALNSLACAFAMERLAVTLSSLEQAPAYPIGLLRHVGKLALNQLCAERADAAGLRFPGEEAEGGSLEEWEQSVLGMTSASAAAVLMDGWKFPAVVCRAIEAHAQDKPIDQLPVEAVLLRLSAAVAAQATTPMPGDRRYLREAGQLAATLGCPPEELASCAVLVAKALGRWKTLFR